MAIKDLKNRFRRSRSIGQGRYKSDLDDRQADEAGVVLVQV